MVDFRYHIVSLISVFLALAIGIVLGAGPLRENLGDSLTSQVGVLREEKEQLRSELQISQNEQQISDALMLAGGRELLATSLNTYTVAMIDLGDIEDSTRDPILQGFETANATTTSPIEVTDEWWAPGRASFRSGIATSLLEYLDPQPADAASTEYILGMALAQALTARDAAEPTQPASSSEQILSILVSANLIVEPVNPIVPAHALTIFLPTLEESEEETPEAEPWVQTLMGIGQSPAVVISELEEPDSVLEALRGMPGTNPVISTTDSAGMAVSEILVPRIIAHEILGNRNHFSVVDSEYVLWPGPAMLDPWEPEPQTEDESEDPDASSDAEGDPEASSDAENSDQDGEPGAEDPDQATPEAEGGEDEGEPQSLGESASSRQLVGAFLGG